MLQVEKISRASADQRAGRCGRVMSGVCVRLYSEEDYQARARFTDPEILRSSLASVILRMIALKLGDVEEFPFVEAPSSRAVADGYALLQELGAVDEQRRLTPIGTKLAELPIDPSIARMIVAAREESCLTEVLIIASRARHPGPARPAHGEGRRGRSSPRPVRRRALRVSRSPQAVGVLRRRAQAQEVQPQARATVPRDFPVVRASARVARSARSAARPGCRGRLASATRRPRPTTSCIARC